MLQLRSFSRLVLVLVTAPLGLIGVTASLLLFHLPFGFVAMLGVIALSGIILRNSVILIDQIEQDIAAGSSAWNAVIGATMRRSRPITLTAAAAIMAMIPLTQSVFWGPMAVGIMGGLAGATFLTIFLLPALYAAWFTVKEDAVELTGADAGLNGGHKVIGNRNDFRFQQSGGAHWARRRLHCVVCVCRASSTGSVIKNSVALTGCGKTADQRVFS
jgi:multidrug efflux pump